MADLTRGLIPLDTSPLMQVFAMKEQQKQQQIQNERQNRLDQLAMAQFQESKKQNALANARADQNMSINQQNAETNLRRQEMAEAALMREFEAQDIELDKQKMKLAFAEFGPALETAIASIESGQPVPSEVAEQINSGFDTAANMFQSDTLGQAFQSIKEKLPGALSENNEEGWDEIVSDLERMSAFASAEEGMSIEDQMELRKLAAETARAETLAARDQYRLESEVEETETTRNQQEIEANATVDTIRRLLSDRDTLEAATGIIGSRVNLPGGKADRWASEFDTLMKELTLDKMQAFVGAMSEGERQFASEATGLDRTKSADRVEQVLRRYLDMFAQRGYSGSQSNTTQSNIVSEDEF